MIDGKTVVAILQAWSDDQGIPWIADLPVAGKPLLAHVVGEARASRTIDRVVVSTSDPSIARRFGVEVVPTPPGGSMQSSLLQILETLKATENHEPDILVLLQCTSPLAAAEDIEGTVEALIREEADTAVAVTDFGGTLWKVDGGDAVSVEDGKRFVETGAVYAMRVAGFKSSGRRVFGKTALYEMPRSRSFKVEGPQDLPIVEALLRSRQQGDRLAMLPETIGALVFDFDGVFTDNRVIVNQDGVESVACDRSDGWGLTRLKRLGVPILVLSTEKNPVVRARCGKLGLTCLQGVDHKWSTLQGWLAEQGVDPQTVTYVGNDVNDLECLQNVGCGVAPADAYPEARLAARIVLNAQGGRGAVREIVEVVLAKLGKSDEILGG